MTYRAPVVGSAIVFHPGRSDRVGGYGAAPGLVNAVANVGSRQTVTLTAFLIGGSSIVRDAVIHAQHWRAMASNPGFDADGIGYWEWPGAGVDDALAPGI